MLRFSPYLQVWCVFNHEDSMKDSCSQQYPIMTILLTIVIHPSNHFYQIHLSSILFLSNHLSSIHFNPVIHHLSINSYSCISFMNSYHLSLITYLSSIQSLCSLPIIISPQSFLYIVASLTTKFVSCVKERNLPLL